MNIDILRSCHGIIFFAVPNKGMGLENKLLVIMVKGQPNSQFIQDLGGSQFLNTLNEEFCLYSRSKSTKIICYYETRNTPTVKVLLLTRNSSPLARLLKLELFEKPGNTTMEKNGHTRAYGSSRIGYTPSCAYWNASGWRSLNTGQIR